MVDEKWYLDIIKASEHDIEFATKQIEFWEKYRDESNQRLEERKRWLEEYKQNLVDTVTGRS